MDQNNCTNIEGILHFNQSKVRMRHTYYAPFTTSAALDVVGVLPEETISLMKATRPKEQYYGWKKLLN
jgi:hypothetical protein